MQHASLAYPSSLIPVLETVLFCSGLLLLYFKSDTCRRWSDGMLASLSRLVPSPGRAVLLVGLVAGLGSAAISLIQGPPIPTVSDEWSYLLSGDTFAAGRVTNPASPHPALVGVNVIGHPTYQSKYPPASSLILALGKRIGGHPALGLWLSAGLLAAACTWCFQAWVASEWALLGGLLLAVRLGLGSYWNQSYWGGSVAAIGGALVYGAVRRLTAGPRLRHSLLLGLGLALLATSRPFEGLLVCLPAAWILGRWLFSLGSAQRWAALEVVVVPVVSLLALTAVGIGYYNWRVTGDPSLMPHFHYKEIHSSHSEFVWNRTPGNASQHLDLGRPKDGGVPSWWSVGLLQGAYRFWLVLFFLLSPALAVPLLLGAGALRGRGTGPLVIACLLVLFGHFAADQFYPHYSAPLTAPLWVLALTALGSLRQTRWRERPVGAGLSLVAVMVLVISFLVQVPAFRPDAGDLSRATEEIRTELENEPGRHLVLLHSGIRLNFNSADLWGAKVLLAFDLGTASNRELFELYPDRRKWRMTLYGSSVEVQPVELE